ncbi:5-methyltetrahydrofolate--homocysteine methyltransferase [hydrothermal vent metagenome]|uniref:methionine synthase n=1 Tax=hydrothermal vent metagenome TaxID=652676 RepID=A0A3B0TCN7_9ZZZZ
MTISRQDRLEFLERKALSHVLVLDGAMGTQIQDLKFDEVAFRGGRFADWNQPLAGNNDLLNLTQPEAIGAIHGRYFEAGADIVESNTFSSTAIAQADYGLEAHAADIAAAGARLARLAADAAETEERPRAVAGAIGPTSKTLSISPDVNDPGSRAASFDDIHASYLEQARAMASHVDFFLVETMFDTLNGKAAIKALLDHRDEYGEIIPVLLSGTIPDASGRTLSGQTTAAMWNSIRHANPWAVGFNCALGAKQLRAHVAEIARVADTRILAYPNAGLPNEMAEYDELPEETAVHLTEWASSGLVNIVGGCCGTTPAHIAAIAKGVAGTRPRPPAPPQPVAMRLSGLEPFDIAG